MHIQRTHIDTENRVVCESHKDLGGSCEAAAESSDSLACPVHQTEPATNTHTHSTVNTQCIVIDTT